MPISIHLVVGACCKQLFLSSLRRHKLEPDREVRCACATGKTERGDPSKVRGRSESRILGENRRLTAVQSKCILTYWSREGGKGGADDTINVGEHTLPCASDLPPMAERAHQFDRCESVARLQSRS